VIFGGPVIHDFSLTMFIGIMSGIYSSHFISPGIAWWLGRMGAMAPVSRGSGPGGGGSGVRGSDGSTPPVGKNAVVGT
jgi:hypothetical protein